ncbi:MFS transporter [Micrococcales bacterium 31B]|nr:MFS transporter [Micrococcales bacterium 31B]
MTTATGRFSPSVTLADARYSTIVCFLAWTFAVYDFVLFANLLPVVAEDFGWSDSQTTGINTWVTLGTAVVAFFAGPLIVDKLGRKKGIIIAVVGAALASGLTYVGGFAVTALGVTGIVLLVLIRSVAGLGYAEQSINATYLNEIYTVAYRGHKNASNIGFLYSLVQSGWPVGSVIAAVSIQLIEPRYGWEMCFIVGVFPSIVMAILGRRLKESPQFLAQREVQRLQQAGDAASAESVAREYGISLASKVGAPLSQAFQGESLRPTLTLGAAMLLNWLGILAFAFQGTLILTNGKDAPFTNALAILIVSNATGFFGYLFHGWFGDKIGRRNAIMIGWAIAAIAFLVMLLAPNGGFGLIVTMYSAGLFFLIGPYSALLFYTSESFPVQTRATAGSFINALGQIGAILGGVLFTIHLSGLTADSPVADVVSRWTSAGMIYGCIPIFLSAAVLLLARNVKIERG